MALPGNSGMLQGIAHIRAIAGFREKICVYGDHKGRPTNSKAWVGAALVVALDRTERGATPRDASAMPLKSRLRLHGAFQANEGTQQRLGAGPTS